MATRKSSSRRKARPALATYFELSQRPLQVLLFLLPLVALYELGVFYFLRNDIIARSMLKSFFQHMGMGAAGLYLPGIAVVVLLLTMHLVQGEAWSAQPRLFPMMWIESFVLALPILLFSVVFLRSAAAGVAPLSPVGPDSPSWQSLLVLSIGAGIYEELIFRVIGIALIHAFMIDLLALPRHVGELTSIAITALLFTFYHRTPDNPLTVRKFVFYLLAGVYLACIYVYRGFGIVAGAHALYDVMVFSLAELQHD
jgi:membrane protease YdiL (CAAX protease family)